MNKQTDREKEGQTDFANLNIDRFGQTVFGMTNVRNDIRPKITKFLKKIFNLAQSH